MVRTVSIIKWISVIVSLVIFNACGGGGSSNNNANTQGGTEESNISNLPIVEKVENFKLESIDISLIGDAKSKYILDKALEDTKNGELAVDALQNVGISNLDMENKDDPIIIDSGIFYNFKVTLDVGISYPEGLNFMFVLVKQDDVNNEHSYSKMIYSTTKEIDETGEYIFSINTLIGTDIPAGKYMLVVYVLEQELENIANQNKPIDEISEMGATYIEIEKNDNAKRVEIINIKTEPYIDLPDKDKFINGHTNKNSGSSSLSFVNTSDKEEKVTITAKMEFENGQVIDLLILDTKDGKVKDEVSKSIPVFSMGEKETNVYNLVFTYYLPESRYNSLIDVLPDMSKDETSDGLRGVVKWNISSVNTELKIDEEKESQFEMTKYENTYLLSPLATSLTFTGTNMLDQLTLDTTNYDWTKNVVFNWPIEAVLDFDNNYAYVFSQNMYAKYDKRKKEIVGYWHDRDGTITVNGLTFIDTKWKGIPFNKIDAVFKDGDIAYFFSDDKYIRYSLQRQEVIIDEDEDGDTSPTALISIKNFVFPEMSFTHIDAAVNDYHGYVYLLSGTQYVKIDINKHTIVDGIHNIEDKWGNVGKITAALSDSQGKDRVVFFNNKEVKTKFLNKGEILFKYEDEFKKQVGDPSVISLSFKSGYGLEGHWMVPGIDAHAYANIDFNFLDDVKFKKNNIDPFKSPYRLFNFNLEMAASINKLHPLAEHSLLSNIKSRQGAKLQVEILGEVYRDDNTMSETLVTEITSPDDIHQDLGNARQVLESKEIILFDEEWREEKVLFHAVLLIIEAKAGVKGYFGVQSSLNFNGVGVGVGVHAPFGVSSFAEAGVTAGVVRAGVEANIVLLEGSLDASAESTIRLDLSRNLVYSLDEVVELNMNFIQGNFYVYGEIWGKIEWCDGGCCLPDYPCGMGYYHSEYEIYRSEWLFNRKWTFLDYHEPIVKLPLQ